MTREPGKQAAPGRQHVRDGAAGQTARVQLRHAAADVLRLHAVQRHARIELEQGFYVLEVVAARARGELALVRQVLEVSPEQLAAGIGLGHARLIRRHGYKYRSRAALNSSPRRLR